MLEARSTVSLWLDRALFAMFVALFGWALLQRVRANDARHDATGFVILLAGMVLMSGAPLVRHQGIRYVFMAMSAVAMLMSFLAR